MTEPQFTPPAHPSPTAVSPPQPPSNGLAIASMVLGIVSIVGFMGFLLGIPAIVLGIIALNKKSGEKAMSITGIVTGAISTVISLLLVALFVWAIASSSAPTDSSTDSDRPTESEYAEPLPPNEI